MPITQRHRAGVDIGGTFTDLIIFDDASGALVIGKTLTTPADPSQAIETGLAETLGRAGLALSAGRPDNSRHDAGHQCDHRAQGRAHGAAGDGWLPRCGRDRPRASLRPVRPDAGAAAAADPALPALRCAAAHAGRWQHAPRAGCRVCRAAGARVGGGRCRRAGDRVSPQLCQPGCRAPGACGGAARRAGHARVDLVRCCARDPRVRAHQHHCRECLRATVGSSATCASWKSGSSAPDSSAICL